MAQQANLASGPCGHIDDVWWGVRETIPPPLHPLVLANPFPLTPTKTSTNSIVSIEVTGFKHDEISLYQTPLFCTNFDNMRYIVHVHSQLALSKNFCLNRGWHLLHKVPQNLMHKVPPLLSDEPQLSAYKTKTFHWFLIWHKERPQMGLFWEFRSHTQLLPHMGSSFSEQPCSLAPYPTLKKQELENYT